MSDLPAPDYARMRRLDRHKISHILVHCDYTRPSMNTDINWIRRIHMTEKGMADVGYHFLIRRDGTVQSGRAMEYQGAHEPKRNRDSLAICLSGGMAEARYDSDGRRRPAVPECNFTPQQFEALRRHIHFLVDWVRLKTGSDPAVSGHNTWAKKACPCFNVAAWYYEKLLIEVN